MSSVVAVLVATALAIEPPTAAPTEAPIEDAAPEPAPEPAADPPPESPVASPTEPAPAPAPAPAPVGGHDHAAGRAAGTGGVGGYDDAFDLRGRPPRDGEDEVLAGSIVLPLGIIGAASSGVQLWLSMPGECQDRWDRLGSRPSAEQCNGLYAFSIGRVVHSSLMAAAGGVLLGIGLVRRKKFKEWHRHGGTARLSVAPWATRTGAGLGVSVRFGNPSGPRTR